VNPGAERRGGGLFSIRNVGVHARCHPAVRAGEVDGGELDALELGRVRRHEHLKVVQGIDAHVDKH